MFHKEDVPGPLLGRDLWFDSCKRPPAVSDHQVFTFWVVAYGRVTTVVSNLYKCPCSRLGPKFAYSLYGVFVGLLRQSISMTYSDEETGSYHVTRNTKASRNNERPRDYARTCRSQKRTVRASDPTVHLIRKARVKSHIHFNAAFLVGNGIGHTQC